jgi:hypothetical protein
VHVHNKVKKHVFSTLPISEDGTGIFANSFAVPELHHFGVVGAVRRYSFDFDGGAQILVLPWIR